MAERRPLGRKLQFQYLFDRLLPDKLEQVYHLLLVADDARPIGCPGTTLSQENEHDASCGHLHPSRNGRAPGDARRAESMFLRQER